MNSSLDSRLDSRLGALESQLRRWKLVTVLLVLAFAVLLFVAAAPQAEEKRGIDNGFVMQATSPMMRSQSFVVVGSDGKVYARLTTNGDKPVLNFYDSKGHVIWSAPPNNGMQAVGIQGIKK